MAEQPSSALAMLAEFFSAFPTWLIRSTFTPCKLGLLILALATAYRRPCEREVMGDEAVGWQRWRRQLLQQNRDRMIISAHGYDGIFPMVESILLLRVKLKDVPPGIGTHQDILTKYGFTSHA